MSGLINGTEAVNLSVYDKDIHSLIFDNGGVLHSSDAYVLQGGSPEGFDTGDFYEDTQAPGHYAFLEAPSAPVPEANSLALLSMGGLPVLLGLRRHFSRSA